MDRQLKEIIRRQQEYEFLKHAPSAADKGAGLQDPFLTAVVLPKIKADRQKQQFKKTLTKITRALFLLFVLLAAICLIAAAFYAPDHSDDDFLQTYKNTPQGQAETAIAAGEYDKAKQILDDAVKEHSDGHFYHTTYAQLYVAMGDCDAAVTVLADAIENIFHVQNIISSQAPYYQALKEISPEALTDTRSRYKECLSACDSYIAKYKKLETLLDEENYYSALLLCDELKEEGAYDNYLCNFYCKCYIGLKAYDQGAKYLLGLFGKKENLFDLRYPDDGELFYEFEQFKEKVSPALKAEVEALEKAGFEQ